MHQFTEKESERGNSREKEQDCGPFEWGDDTFGIAKCDAATKDGKWGRKSHLLCFQRFKKGGKT